MILRNNHGTVLMQNQIQEICGKFGKSFSWKLLINMRRLNVSGLVKGTSHGSHMNCHVRSITELLKEKDNF